jgi:hypothetical protein
MSRPMFPSGQNDSLGYRATHTAHMIDASASDESVPPNPSPEQPPLAPYDPPDPAPQAAAWQRALRVVFMETTHTPPGTTRNRSWKSNRRGRAAIKSRNH